MGKTSGTLAGAGTGAAIGTAIMPGIGTAAGAIVGGLAGYFGSSEDKSVTPYQADPNSFRYGGHMSGVANERIQSYDAQGGELRGEARRADQRALGDTGAQGYADRAAQAANNGLGGIDQARANQLAALGRMQQGNNAVAGFAAQPQGPSAAQAQLQQAANQSFAQQMAMARSGQNAGGSAAAMRAAAFQQAGIMGNAGMQSAQLSAQEAQAFRAQQLQALGLAQQGYGAEAGAAQGLRSGDQSSGQLMSGTALQAGQMQTGTALSRGNQAMQNQQMNDQYALGLGQLAGQQDQFSQNVYGQQLGANMQEQQLASQNYNAAMGLNTSQQNANDAGMFGMAGAGFGMAGQIIGSRGGGGGGAAGGDSGSVSSDAESKKEIARLSGALRQTLGALGRAPDDAVSVGGAQLPRVGTFAGDDPYAQYGRGIADQRDLDRDTSEFGAARVHEAAALGIPTARYPDQAQPPTARFPDAPPDFRPAQGYRYEYRDPSAPGAAPGEHYGPMAQDLERTPAGASVVETGPDGMKRVNAPRLTMLNTSALSEQQRRQDALERQNAALQMQLEALGRGKKKQRGPGDAGLYGIDASGLVDLDDAYDRERATRY